MFKKGTKKAHRLGALFNITKKLKQKPQQSDFRLLGLCISLQAFRFCPFGLDGREQKQA
jgi:hypothetical protein